MAEGNTKIGTAFLEVEAEADKSSVSKLQESFKSAGEKSGNYFTDGFKSFGKKIIGALGAYEVGKKIAETVVSAVNAYADFEQLKGGVEKIFDEADQAKILKDAQEAYKDLNMSANEYLTSINNVGATFAQTMGDQKGYDTARKGMKAIADYASGTGANLEELNDKYKLITRSASSYQSIADQFAGILPATSKDFLKQAQAAGYLKDEYTQLTQVPLDEYQEAVTNMLEKGVDAMGLLGNTAAETEGTLSGSIAGMKSAWENFLVALGDPDGNIEESLGNLMHMLGATVENIIPLVGNIISELIIQLPELIEQLVPVIVEAVERLILKVGEKLQEGFDGLMTDFGNWVADLVNGSEEAGDGMAEGIGAGVQTANAELDQFTKDTLAKLDSMPDSAYSSGRSVPASFGQGILDNFSAAIDPMAALADAASGYLPHSPAKYGAFSGKGYPLYSGMAIAESLGEGFTRKIGYVQAQIANGMRGVASAINGGGNYNITMNVAADSNTTIDNLIEQANRRLGRMGAM